MEDLYKVLEVNSEATSAELKKSYQELALLYHPDKTGSSSEKFIEINRAYKILCDSELRMQYDLRWRERCLAQAYPIQDTVDFDEFEEIISENSSNSDQSKGDNSVVKNLQGKGDKCDKTAEQTKGENHNANDSEIVYVYTCRCGGNYVLTAVDVRLKFDIVCCDSCSLTVQILYAEEH